MNTIHLIGLIALSAAIAISCYYVVRDAIASGWAVEEDDYRSRLQSRRVKRRRET